MERQYGRQEAPEDASMRCNEEGIGFILTRERLWKSTDHILIVVASACENEKLCKEYAANFLDDYRHILNESSTARARRGLESSCCGNNFGVAMGNARWGTVPKEPITVNIMKSAIMECNMELIKNPIVPEHIKPYIDNTPLNREDVIDAIECASEHDNFGITMLEYFGIEPHELTLDINDVCDKTMSFSVFCELRDSGYLESTSSDDYSPYHYLYDMQRGLEPRELDYSNMYNSSHLFLLFTKCDDPIIKHGCAERLLEIMRTYEEYHPYIIRKIYEWNSDLLDEKRRLVERLIGGDILMEEWYNSKC